MPGPLHGTRVLDLTRILAGPFATMKLGDMGADVVKVELPRTGDDTRTWGPPFVQGEAAYYLAVNRNKRSITLDLKHPRGREVLERLVRAGDIVVENFRPGTMEKLQFGWDRVRALNPRMIYAAVSGYGHTGSRSTEPSYDVIVQGESGLMDLTGLPDGPPTKVGVSIADLTAGQLAVEGILLALIERGRTGQGQKVDVALLDGILSLFTYQGQNYFATGKPSRRMGNRHPSITPYETFQASDAHVNVGVANESFWKPFCEAIGREDLLADPRFKDNPSRIAHREELAGALAQVFATQPAQHWVDALSRRGVPVGHIRTVGDVLDDPARAERDMVWDLPHPKIGALRAVGNPIKLSGHHDLPRRPPPRLGEHTDEILAELGYSGEEVRALHDAGAV